MAFQPMVDDELTIEGIPYRVTPHPAPAAAGLRLPYGQTGRRATVYQLAAPRGLVALKVFTPAFRDAAVAGNAERLRPFAALRGLGVCDRLALTPQRHAELLRRHPDLECAVLMPWVAGETWQELVLRRQVLTPAQSQGLARALAEILAAMEARKVAHCDLSAPNVLITLDPLAVALVDVEELYAPGLPRPAHLPAGSPGYAHRTASAGLWGPEADRFAGAILLAECLGWCDERVRQAAEREQYFAAGELQEDGVRFQTLLTAVREHWGDALQGLLAATWQAPTLGDCPPLAEWASQLGVAVAGVPRAIADETAGARLPNSYPADTAGSGGFARQGSPPPPPVPALAPLPDLRRRPPEPVVPWPTRAQRWLKQRTRPGRTEAGNDATIGGLMVRLATGTRTVAMIGPKGGVGKSSVALVTGLVLAQVPLARPILVELNPDWGTLDELLGEANTRTIQDVLTDYAAIDRTGIGLLQAYVTMWGRLPVLTAPSNPDAMARLTPRDYDRILRLLSVHYNIILLDCGTAFTQRLNQFAIQRADHLAVVGWPEQATLRKTLAAIEYLVSARYERDYQGILAEVAPAGAAADVRARALEDITLVLNGAGYAGAHDPVDPAKVHQAARAINEVVDLPYSPILRSLLADGTLTIDNLPVAYRRAVKVLLVAILGRLAGAPVR